MIPSSLVLTHYQRVTDRQTDMLPIAESRSSRAQRDKNVIILICGVRCARGWATATCRAFSVSSYVCPNSKFI